MTVRAYRLSLLVLTVLLAGLFFLPHVLFAVREQHPGVLRMVTTDDGQYHARIRAALLHRFDEVQNGMTGGKPAAKGGSPALLELIAGTLFFWTPLKAPQVLLLLTVLLTPLFLPLLATFLRALCLPRGTAPPGAPR